MYGATMRGTYQKGKEGRQADGPVCPPGPSCEVIRVDPPHGCSWPVGWGEHRNGRAYDGSRRQKAYAGRLKGVPNSLGVVCYRCP
ncbi:hypothetical protein AA0313_2918 [Acetobacter indonesiensis NRIC 0313]|uniref:Uncharacterized protein n=1 Tax=Acetobacter indonesiensis TaxID=104101 RepID=A0A6N3TA46_9PROT|nr:hypothetical protein Abin_012_038 [Acetobacter indonesiensis]GBQ62215.1 hypothetical protein AA0313_2918 [Acetobacter indonesiensis NRIC 0313]GEN04619.1 hypothetical protein AIN02nite_26440 [Acetobacter indonesiensis]